MPFRLSTRPQGDVAPSCVHEHPSWPALHDPPATAPFAPGDVSEMLLVVVQAPTAMSAAARMVHERMLAIKWENDVARRAPRALPRQVREKDGRPA